MPSPFFPFVLTADSFGTGDFQRARRLSVPCGVPPLFARPIIMPFFWLREIVVSRFSMPVRPWLLCVNVERALFH